MARRYYHIPDTFLIACSDAPITSPFWVLRDKPRKRQRPSTKLEKLFTASHKTFRVRVRDLGDLSTTLTEHDAAVLQIMLDALIVGKREISKERGE